MMAPSPLVILGAWPVWGTAKPTLPGNFPLGLSRPLGPKAPNYSDSCRAEPDHGSRNGLVINIYTSQAAGAFSANHTNDIKYQVTGTCGEAALPRLQSPF